MNYRPKGTRLFGVALAAILIAVAILTVACSNNSEVVASVNGEPISKDELYDVLVKQNGSQALDTIIMKKVVSMEAHKENVQVSEGDVDKEIEEMAEQYGGIEAFSQVMNMYGYDVEGIKEDLKMNLIIEGLMKPRIDISQDEMEEYFELNKENFVTEEQVRASHILTETKDAAVEVKEKLDDGGDFADLAKEYSIDNGTKDFGGDLGIVRRGEMVTEFEDAVFSLETGIISEPVKTEFGYHIIQVEEKKEAQEADFERSKEEIEKILLNNRIQTEFNLWYQERLDEYEIKNFLE